MRLLVLVLLFAAEVSRAASVAPPSTRERNTGLAPGY